MLDVTPPRVRRLRRRWKRQTGFTDGALQHEVVVAAGPDGRPGERLLAPSRSLFASRMCPDDSREDFRVLLDRWPSTLASVCLRRVEDEREVEESAWFALNRALERGNGGKYEIAPATIAGEAALGYTIVLRRSMLTDWKLAHEGWLFVIGVLSPRDEQLHEDAVRRAREALATWEWLSEEKLR